MRRPKLASADIRSLRSLFRAARRLDEADRNYDDPLSEVIRQDIKALETQATSAALYWWTHVPSNDAKVELSRWHEAFKWVQTRNGWTAYRLIQFRLCYGTKPVATGVDVKPQPDFVRI
jgi:hypothetical protein